MKKVISDILIDNKNVHDKTAIEYLVDDKVVEKSWDDLYTDSKNVSNWLLSNNINNQRLAILAANEYAIVKTIFGITATNNSAVMLNSNDTDTNLKENLESINSQIVFCTKSLVEKAYSLNKECNNALSIYIIEDLDFSNNKELKATVKEDDIAFILFTSGTTGKAKAVPLTHKNILSTIKAFVANVTIEPGYKHLNALPLYHTFGLVVALLMALYVKNVVCLGRSIMMIKKYICIFKPCMISLTPAMIGFLIKTNNDSFSIFKDNCITHIFCGGAPVSKKTEEEFLNAGIYIFNGYGITECSPLIASNLVKGKQLVLGSAGQVLSCCKVKIVDGEILVKGDNVFSGYLNANNDCFVDGWFKTGDTGYIGEKGELYVTGRIKKLIILPNGENVAAEPLEEQIYRLDYVTEVLVYDSDNKITAEVYCANQDSDTYDKLKHDIEEINRNLPLTHCITKIILRDKEFKKNALGKIRLY